jgi:hypothetical protein
VLYSYFLFIHFFFFLPFLAHSNFQSVLVCVEPSFEIQFGLAGPSRIRLIWNWNRIGLKKNKKRYDPVWPGRPGGLTRQNLIKNPVAIYWIFFFIKMILFWIFFKIEINQWSGQNPEPEPWIEPDLKIICRTLCLIFLIKRKTIFSSNDMLNFYACILIYSDKFGSGRITSLPQIVRRTPVWCLWLYT